MNPVTCTASFLTSVVSYDLFIRKVSFLILLVMDVSNLILKVQKLDQDEKVLSKPT